MAGLATKETNRSVEAFINSLESQGKREDSKRLVEMIKTSTGYDPKIWGNEKVPDFIIGFGKYSYQRKGSKEEFEWFKVGFAPRKSKITIYLTMDIGAQSDVIPDLGKCKWGKGCLYINKLDDINLNSLSKLIKRSAESQWHS